MFSLLPDLTCLLIQPSCLLGSGLTLNQANRRGRKMLCSALNLSGKKKRATKTAFSTLFAESQDAQCECKPNTYPSHISVCWVMSRIKYLGKRNHYHICGQLPSQSSCHFYLAIEPTSQPTLPKAHSVSPRQPLVSICSALHFWPPLWKLSPEKKVGSALSSGKKECDILWPDTKEINPTI